jgi:hypothetical protein
MFDILLASGHFVEIPYDDCRKKAMKMYECFEKRKK